MKKYITIAAFLGAGCAFAGADDYIGRTEEGNSGANCWVYNEGNAFSLSLSWAGFVNNTTGFVIDSNLDYYLRGIQLNVSNSAETYLANVEVYDGDMYLGCSNEWLTAKAAQEFNDGNQPNNGYAATFTFDNLILDAETVYTFKFVGKSNDETQATSTDTAYQLWSKSVDDTESGVGYVSDSTDYLPWIRLGVQAVPEPSAFGMLAGLGALALVAARRRRK